MIELSSSSSSSSDTDFRFAAAFFYRSTSQPTISRNEMRGRTGAAALGAAFGFAAAAFFFTTGSSSLSERSITAFAACARTSSEYCSREKQQRATYNFLRGSLGFDGCFCWFREDVVVLVVGIENNRFLLRSEFRSVSILATDECESKSIGL